MLAGPINPRVLIFHCAVVSLSHRVIGQCNELKHQLFTEGDVLDTKVAHIRGNNGTIQLSIFQQLITLKYFKVYYLSDLLRIK